MEESDDVVFNEEMFQREQELKKIIFNPKSDLPIDFLMVSCLHKPEVYIL